MTTKSFLLAGDADLAVEPGIEALQEFRGGGHEALAVVPMRVERGDDQAAAAFEIAKVEEEAALSSSRLSADWALSVSSNTPNQCQPIVFSGMTSQMGCFGSGWWISR